MKMEKKNTLVHVKEKSKKTCFSNCYTKYEDLMESLFERIGIFISHFPITILIICILVNGAFMSGFMWLKSENDVEVLYTPENSQSFLNRESLKQIYRDPTGENFHPYQLPDFGKYADLIIFSKERTNLNLSVIAEMRQIDQYVKNSIFVFDSHGKMIYFKDLCAMNLEKCAIYGDIVLSLEFQQDFLSGKATFPLYKGTLLSSILADAKSKNGNLTSTFGIKLRYYLRQDNILSSNWETNFLEKINLLKTNLTDISYATSESLGEELEKNTNGDIQFFSLTFTLMLTYACIASSSSFLTCNNVANRIMLGLAGAFAPILGIGSALGAVSAIGIKFTSIVGVMPFLVVGIGIDDMFILMSGIAEAPSLGASSIEERMRYMLQKSGIAITITSITDLLAFGIGATSVFISIKNFCIFTGVAVFFCYLNQLFFLCPAICLNEKRTRQKRHFLSCMKIKSSNEVSKASLHKYCCTGDIPENRGDVESALEKYPKLFVIRFLLKPILGKIMIVIVFMAYIGASVYGAINLKQGLSLYNLVSDHSYFYKYSVWDEDYFTTEPIITLCIRGEQKYSSQMTQNIISSILSKALTDPNIDKNFEINWLQSYTDSTFYKNNTEKDFIIGLKSFLNTSKQFYNDIVFNKNQSSIISSKIYVKSLNIQSTEAQGSLMLRLRELSDNADIPSYFYAPAFIFYEQFVQIWPSTLQTVGVALAVMFVITILFMPHPLMVFIVTITLVSILTGIFGFMHIWDLTLSSITMIHLVISVGFSVDFSVHICHAFLTVRSEKRDKILQLAFDKAGGPIFNAAFSSLLGIAMLGLSQSYIFQSFGKVMFLVIGFGLLHAALFLPLVLWFLFPCFSTKKDDKNNIQKPTPLFSICAEKYDKNDLSQDNKEPIQISNIIDLNVEISRKLNLKHISSCTHSANLSLKCIQSIPVVYAIDKVLAYTHKKVAIYSSGKHELSYWELFHSLED